MAKNRQQCHSAAGEESPFSQFLKEKILRLYNLRITRKGKLTKIFTALS